MLLVQLTRRWLTVKITNEKEMTKARTQENIDRALDTFLKAQLQFYEAVGIRKNEPNDYLNNTWQRVSRKYILNLYETSPTIFKTLGNYSAIDQLSGLAKSGIRITLIGSGSEIPVRYSTSSVAPFIINWFSLTGKLIPTPNMFQLVARTAQQSVDFSLIAQYVSEKSLCPGMVIHGFDPENSEKEKVEVLDLEKMQSFLGFPDDEIETPSEIQKKYFRDKRRRIPDYSKLNVSINPDNLTNEVAAFFNEALEKFAKLTRRSYKVIEQMKTDDADVVIVATANNFNWLTKNLPKLNKGLNAKIGLLNPALISPFPNDQISKLLKGKKKVVYISGYLIPEHDPVFGKLSELTKSVAFSVNTGKIDSKKIEDALKKVLEGNTKHFDISVQREVSTDQIQESKNKKEAEPVETKEQVIKEELPEETGAEITSGDNFRQLLSYFITGKVTDPELKKNVGLNLKPAFLAKAEITSNRNFPVCLNRNDSEHFVKPIPKIIDEIVTEETKGEEGNDNFKSNLSLLKLKLESLVNGKHGEKLSELWDRAADSILSEMKTDNGQKEETQKNLQKAKTRLAVDGDVLSHDRSFPLKVIDESLQIAWAEKSIFFRDQLQLLINQLIGILGVDLAGKAGGENFGSSVASAFEDELDFDSFTNIVDESFESKPLPKAKQVRIQNLLKDLSELQEFYSVGENINLFKFQCDATNCAATIGQIQARIRKTTKFFRAFHIAKLEIENKYQEEKHDQFFNEFTTNHLTAEDLEQTPPIMLYLNSQHMDETQLAAITEILTTDLPIKIILLNNDVMDESGLLPDQQTWSTKFAKMAISLNNVYVYQSTVADGEQFANGILNGMKYNGPALFNIFIGTEDDSLSVPLELISSMAEKSRAFPTLIYNPAKSSDWGLRFNIHDNPQCENDWVLEKFTYQDSSDNKNSIDLAFTFVDFLAADPRFSNHFLYLPRNRWHENMLLVQDYLKLKPEESKYKLPYILMVGGNGILFRVIPSSFVIRMALSWLDIWRSLQELGLYKEEQTQLDEQKKKEIAEVEEKYQKESVKSENELKRQVISNLLTRLLSGDLKSPIDISTPATPVDIGSAPTVETADKPAEEVPAKEETGGITDPYIDTPLCTSCNECTNINNRMFAYNENKQAYIKDAKAGTFKELVKAAEKCPARIIHPGKPLNPNETGLDKLIKRAEPFN